MKRKAMRFFVCLFEIAKEGNYSTNLLHVQLHSRERIRNCIQITEKKTSNTQKREEKKNAKPTNQSNHRHNSKKHWPTQPTHATIHTTHANIAFIVCIEDAFFLLHLLSFVFVFNAHTTAICICMRCSLLPLTQLMQPYMHRQSLIRAHFSAGINSIVQSSVSHTRFHYKIKYVKSKNGNWLKAHTHIHESGILRMRRKTRNIWCTRALAAVKVH